MNDLLQLACLIGVAALPLVVLGLRAACPKFMPWWAVPTHDDASPAQRFVRLLAFLPILGIPLIGFYSRRHYGTDGVVGVLLGLYGLIYIMVESLRGRAEKASRLCRLILTHRTAAITFCLLLAIGGVLDIYGLL